MIEWINLIQKHKKRLAVEASRDHGKSWYFSYGNPLFDINSVQPGEEPKFMALGSYSEEQAMKNLKRIRLAVEEKPSLKWLLPKSKSSTWDTGELDFSNGCTINTFGVGSSIRGGHFHKVIFDDPTKDHWTIGLEQQKNFLFGVIVPAVRREGQLIVCGTPVSLQDLLWVLEENQKFPLYKFPALDEHDKPLWEEQYTYADLMDIKSLIGSYVFSREYLLKRMNSEDAQFKMEWIKYYQDKPEGRYFRVMTVDPTLEGKDAMGIVITDTNENMDSYVIHSGAYKGTVQEAVETIFELHGRYNPDLFGVETFVFQKMMKLWIEMEQDKRNIHFPIVELEKEGVRKTYKARVMSLQPKVESGKILFRENKDEELVNQLLNWDPESKTNTDDLLIALAHQVPIWERPYEGEVKKQETSGTFNEALEQMMNHPLSDFEKLWSDLKR